jgi:hypothetical protein
MKTNPSDITRTVISNDFINNNIYSLFPDSIFLDADFRILGLSSNIAHSLGFKNEEIRGYAISILENSGELKEQLKARLENGYFNDESIQFIKKEGGTCCYSVSGFYLGMLTECSGLIVLRCINKDELEEIDRKLRQTKLQIDNFIYRTAHDLRGPLATIQGLVNLIKIRPDDSEVDRFIDLIDAHGKKLDERLHRLVYLAKIDEQIVAPTYSLNFSDLETALRRTIENNAFIDFLELVMTCKGLSVQGYDETKIMTIVNNLLLYILSLPKCSTNCMIRINAEENFKGLVIAIKAEGFVADPEIQRSMQNVNPSMYTDLLQSSKFTYLFAAQKIALEAKALISVDYLGIDSEQLTVTMLNSNSISQNNLSNQ